jgi:hypothetical protein
MAFLSKTTICILLLAVCSASGQGQRTTTPGDPTKATAVVTRDEAIFTIPIGQRPVWRWNLATTPTNAREYQWEVAQTGVGAFGFSLFKAPGAKPGAGSLSALITVGQSTIWEGTPDGKGGRMVGTVIVKPVQKDAAVELVVEAPQVLKQFLTARPNLVEIVTRMPDLPDQHYSIPVKYEDH